MKIEPDYNVFSFDNEYYISKCRKYVIGVWDNSVELLEQELNNIEYCAAYRNFLNKLKKFKTREENLSKIW
jgi:hypothetical protein